MRAEWSVLCFGYHVDIAWRLGAKRAGLVRRSHLELKRRLNLELKGVDPPCVERRRQGDGEWKCDEQKAQHDLEALEFCVLKSQDGVCVGRQAGG